ncbi:hypothetical protein [Amycolatopsis sp. NPDC004079]|uniref:hypothetical protein n=1 Tax=Amycolatopsis sp. NPDC004079 TaxID=3154549 RepID=UPI0033BA2AF0
MPGRVQDPLHKTKARLRWLEAIARREYFTVLSEVNGRRRWMPAGVGVAADTWLTLPEVAPLWTSERTVLPERERLYRMTLTSAGESLLSQWRDMKPAG